jgi:hypothetical protein
MHPNLVKFRGYVAASGAVRASWPSKTNMRRVSERLISSIGRLKLTNQGGLVLVNYMVIMSAVFG